MKKVELVAEIANRADMTKKDAAVALEATLEAIRGALVAEEKVTMQGFGVFETVTRKARKGINPKTREPIDIPAKKTVVFRPSELLKSDVRGE